MPEWHERDVERYLVGILVGFLVAASSLFVAVVVPLSPDTGLLTGAAWSWAIGAATSMWAIPWAKKAVPSGGAST